MHFAAAEYADSYRWAFARTYRVDRAGRATGVAGTAEAPVDTEDLNWGGNKRDAVAAAAHMKVEPALSVEGLAPSAHTASAAPAPAVPGTVPAREPADYKTAAAAETHVE